MLKPRGAVCNLGCSYCQNYQISHTAKGQSLSVLEFAKVMLDLQKSGCHNVEPVTPTPQTPLIMEALCMARAQGLTVPFVYNCGGYENPDVIRMLDAMVDIYLPDFKYGLEKDALEFSDAPGYPRYAAESIREMVRQVGDDLETQNGVAIRGIIIRHLVLPGRLDNTREALRRIRDISPNIPVSLMSQYTPMPKVKNHPDLGRRLSHREYRQMIDFAMELGLENLFVQEVSSFHLAPDFHDENPFGNKKSD